MKNIFILFFLILFICSCWSHEVPCTALPIQIGFVGFDSSDIDTFILRKFKANDNYQNLIDTFSVINNSTAQYQTSNDTISTFSPVSGILVGYDWQIFIPTKNRTIFISKIISEQKSIRCGVTAPGSCGCINNVYSVNEDNQVVNFVQNNLVSYHYIYINN